MRTREVVNFVYAFSGHSWPEEALLCVIMSSHAGEDKSRRLLPSGPITLRDGSRTTCLDTPAMGDDDAAWNHVQRLDTKRHEKSVPTFQTTGVKYWATDTRMKSDRFARMDKTILSELLNIRFVLSHFLFIEVDQHWRTLSSVCRHCGAINGLPL